MPNFISPHMKLEVSWGLKCVITFNVFSMSFAIKRSCTNNGWDECQFLKQEDNRFGPLTETDDKSI